MRLKHIKVVRKPGRELLYLAVPGKKLVRLPDLPRDSAAFLDAYLTALKDAAPKGRPLV